MRLCLHHVSLLKVQLNGAQLASLYLQVKSMLKWVLVIGGREESLAALKAKLGDGPEVIHFPARSWYDSKWLQLPAGGPSTGYIGVTTSFPACACT